MMASRCLRRAGVLSLVALVLPSVAWGFAPIMSLRSLSSAQHRGQTSRYFGRDAGLGRALGGPARGLEGYMGVLHQGFKAARRIGPLTMVLAAEEGIEYDETDLKKLKVPELKELCKSAGLTTTGKKADLIQRLLDTQAAEMSFGPGGEEEEGAADMFAEGAGDMYDDIPGPDDLTYMPKEDVMLPNVEALQNADATPDMPEVPGMTGGAGRIVTQPRTGNCWHGLFFDVENIGSKPIAIRAIKTASSPEPPTPVREDKMTCSLYMCDGSSAGKEKEPEFWKRIGVAREVQLPTVSYGEPDGFYGAVPMVEPVTLKPGETKGFCVFTDSWRGIVLRAKLGSRFEPGEATDEDAHIRLGAGLLPVNDGGFEDGMFKEVYSETCGDAFVGAIEYDVLG